MDYILSYNWKITIIIGSIVTCASVFTPIVRWLIKRAFVKSTNQKNVDPTSYRFFMNAASFVIWIIAFGIIVSYIPALKSLAITLFASADILVAVVGFAAQQAFSNIINGIFIVFFKPFRVGDMVKIGSQDYGIVEDITLRHTVINNFENKRIIIPNSTVSADVIVNDTITDSKICKWIEIGISYDSDIELATKIIKEESIKHPFCIDVRTEQQKSDGASQVEVRLVSFGESGLILKANVWTSDPLLAFQMKSDINKAIKKRFDSEGVEIPFPYRTVVFKKDLKPNTNTNTNV